MEVRIIEYTPALAPHFERINKHWISKYFTLEPVDLPVLEHPDEYIIAHGGEILFAAVGEEIVGAVALKVIDEETVEMTKMGVDDAYQGYKIGWKLAQAILARAWEKGYKKVVLYSNTKLAPALNMYQKLGFREIPVEEGRYLRSTVKMEINYNEQNIQYPFAEDLVNTVDEWLPILQAVSINVAANRPARGKWSPREIMGHLIDSAINNNVRFIRTQLVSLLEIPAYEQEFWVKGQAWQYHDWQELLSTWSNLNKHLALVIRAIPVKALQHQCKIGQNDPVTLLFLIEDYVLHLKHHLQQVKILINAN